MSLFKQTVKARELTMQRWCIIITVERIELPETKEKVRKTVEKKSVMFEVCFICTSKIGITANKFYKNRGYNWRTENFCKCCKIQMKTIG